MYSCRIQGFNLKIKKKIKNKEFRAKLREVVFHSCYFTNIRDPYSYKAFYYNFINLLLLTSLFKYKGI